MKIKKWIGFDEFSSLNLWIGVLGEIVISCLYIIIVCGSGLTVQPYGTPSNLHGSFTTGLTVAMLANSFWEISGGHFNPAVTISLAVVGKCSLLRCLFYVIGQCLGMFVAVGTGLVDANPTLLKIALTVGPLVATLITISDGGHSNPALTIAIFVFGDMSLLKCGIYIVAQVLGSVAGAGLLYAYLPANLRGGLGAMSLHRDIGAGFAFLIEISITYPFIMTVFASTDPSRGFVGFQAPLAIGLSVTVGLLMAIPITGGCMNPIRAFGPALVMNQRKDHWVYWFGPIVGGVLAALSYKYVFKREDAKKVDHNSQRKKCEQVHEQNIEELCVDSTT